MNVEARVRLQGKTALVVGAGGKDNMGQVIGRRLCDEGARVMAVGRDELELRRFADEIGGGWAVADIAKRSDSFALAETVQKLFRTVDIVVNAAGTNLLVPFEETAEADLRRVTDVQFIGPFMLFQALLPVMGEGGSLIQISSATATIMLNDHAAYMGTKAGLDHVVRCIANEYGHRGIRANSISPGITETPMTAGAKAIPGLWDAYEASYPLGRTGTAADIAAAVVWLASDECFMTGENLQVNGGLVLRGNPSRETVDQFVISRTGKPRPRAH
ncbi:MAG TPA: SDR family oxidoreductase [Sphingomicrobium sp.]|nr:SDR family oxidoreductase [Sphingomicrobium sp.]